MGEIKNSNAEKTLDKFIRKSLFRIDILTVLLIVMCLVVFYVDLLKIPTAYLALYNIFLFIFIFFYLYLLDLNAQNYATRVKNTVARDVILLLKSIALIFSPVFFLVPLYLVLFLDSQSDPTFKLTFTCIVSLQALSMFFTVKVIKDNDSKYMMFIMKKITAVFLIAYFVNKVLDNLEFQNIIFQSYVFQKIVSPLFYSSIFIPQELLKMNIFIEELFVKEIMAEQVFWICNCLKIWGVCILIPIIIYNIIRLFSHIKKHTT
ncbi:hypothetical protein IJE86_10230 [bacterium]|nr:hypothetical protein [bacterium]